MRLGELREIEKSGMKTTKIKELKKVLLVQKCETLSINMLKKLSYDERRKYKINPLTPELNPSAQGCQRLFTGDLNF
jgi:hypothetical protein